MFDKISRVIFLLIVTSVVYVTIFNGDINAVKDKSLSGMPGLATTMSVLLPTSAPPTATRLTIPTRAPSTGSAGGSSGGAVGAPKNSGLADCATVKDTVTACEWKGGTPTAVPAPTATPSLGTKPEIAGAEGCDPEIAICEYPTDPPAEPVLVQQAPPVSNVLSTTADYRSDCHAMFVSKEDKTGWAADIAKCTATGDYK